jgi:hypothetical protein
MAINAANAISTLAADLADAAPDEVAAADETRLV